MPAPTNTYSSATQLSLGAVPQVDDPDLYVALLDIHNALEAILTSSDDGGAALLEFLAKYRGTTVVTADYTVQVTDGLILVDATAGDVTVTLHPVLEGVGYRYRIKRTDSSLNTVLLIGDGTEEIDGETTGWTLDYLDDIPVGNDGANWWIE